MRPLPLRTFLLLAAAALSAAQDTGRRPETGDLNMAQGAAIASKPGDAAGNAQADWKGVRPGESTRAQVESLLGKPTAIRPGEGGTVQYIYPPGAHLGFNRVIFDAAGVVTLVGIGMFDEKDQVRFSELKRRHGQPRKVSQRSMRDFHSDQSTYLFPRPVGLWVVADESSDEVVGATFYDPAREPDIPTPAEPPAK